MMRGLKFRLFFTRVSPIITTIIVVIVLLKIAAYCDAQILENVKSRFQTDVDVIQKVAIEDITNYSASLDSFQSLIEQNGVTSRDGFHNLVMNAGISRNLKGVTFLAYARKVNATDANTFIVNVRNDKTIDPAGYPNYRVFPTKKDGDYFAIDYLEPALSDLHGFDVSSVDNYKSAMTEAIESGKPAISDKNLLYRDKEGFLSFYPIYNTSTALTTKSEREVALKGYIVAGFWSYDLFPAIASDSRIRRDIQIKIYDGRQPQSKDSLFYSTGGDNKSDQPLVQSKIALEAERVLEVRNTNWLLTFTPKSSYLSASERYLPYAISGFAWLGSIATGVFAGFYIRRRVRVIKAEIDKKSTISPQPEIQKPS